MNDDPPPARPRARPKLFRTVELNALGWAAVSALCTAGAAAGWFAARLTRSTPSIAVPAGAVTAFAALIAADRRNEANMPTSYSWTPDPAEVQRMAITLHEAGVPAHADIDDQLHPTLHYRNRYHRRVVRAFLSAGLPPPTH